MSNIGDVGAALIMGTVLSAAVYVAVVNYSPKDIIPAMIGMGVLTAGLVLIAAE